MTLKDFVAETLVQVVAGVHEAQQTVTGRGARINPTHEGGQGNAFTRAVEFDLALTTSNGTIGVLLGGRGLDVASESTKMAHSRVRFTVPVDFPEHRVSA